MSAEPTAATPVPPIQSRGEFQQAIRDAFERAATQGCREIWLCDTDYADWPLGERAVVDALTRWAYAHRRLHMLASSFDDIVRRHPRFVEWRRNWAHVIDCRQLEDLAPELVPRMWLAPGLGAVRLVDPLRFRGFVDAQTADLVPATQTLQDLAEKSEEAFPATLLGL